METRNRLAFPAGRTLGYNQAHTAAKNICLLTCANGANHINLLTGKPGTTAGTPTQKILANLGPAVDFSASAKTTFTGLRQIIGGTLRSGVMAAIVQMPSASAQCNFIDNRPDFLNTIIYKDTDALFKVFFASGSGVNVSSITLSANVPYFLACTFGEIATPLQFVATNLNSGAVAYSSPSNNTSAVDSVGTVGISEPATSNFICAAAMMASVYLSKPQLLDWASDPWALWLRPDA